MGASGDQDRAREERPDSGQTAQGPGGTAQGDASGGGVDGGGRDAWNVGLEGAEQGQEADHDNLWPPTQPATSRR